MLYKSHPHPPFSSSTMGYIAMVTCASCVLFLFLYTRKNRKSTVPTSIAILQPVTPLLCVSCIRFARETVYSLIFARSLRAVSISSQTRHRRSEGGGRGAHSWSLKRVYSSSPTLTGLPPYYFSISHTLTHRGGVCNTGGMRTRSPGLTETSTRRPRTKSRWKAPHLAPTAR